MLSPRPLATYALTVLSVACLAAPAAAQPVTVVHTFTGSPGDGKNPVGALVPFGSALYGMTNTGGSAGDGTIYRMNPDGTGFTVMHSFAGGLTDGSAPYGSLAQSGGVFFGMTEFGGTASDGTIFRMDAAGTNFGLIHSFQGGATDGSSPVGSPTISGGVLYGMTTQGGTANKGVIYRMNPDGTSLQVLHSFTGSTTDGDGSSPSALVVSGGVIYGMTPSGGAAGQGVVFKMNTDGTGFALLHSFTATGDGYGPTGGLTLVGSTLYGMTRQGGTNGLGTVFRINTDGTGYALMHSYAGSPGDGATPASNDLLAVGSTLYGMTHDGGANALGVLLQINLNGTGYGVDHSFAGGSLDGAIPFGSLTELNGYLYGTTVQGGSANDGVAFVIPVPEPSSLLLVATAGAVAAAAARWRSKRKQSLTP
jgi:uncharacterized repeat protein (TIGR03803 family)